MKLKREILSNKTMGCCVIVLPWEALKPQYPIIFKAFPLPSLLLLPDAPHFTIADANTAYLGVTGQKEADLLGRSILDVFRDKPGNLSSELVSDLQESLLTVMNTGKAHSIHIQKYPISIGGSDEFTTVHWGLKNTPVNDIDGNVTGIIHSVTDVKEPPEHEEKHKFPEQERTDESNGFGVELLNTIGQAVVTTDLNGIINSWNKAAEKMYGWTEKEAIGKNVVDFIPAQQTREQAIEIMKELSLGHSWTGEFMVQRKDGRIFPIFATDSPIYDQHHKLSGIIALSNDITQQKEADAQIKNSEQRYRTLFEQNLAGFYQSTLNGALLKCNDAFVKMLKYDSQKELLEMNTNELYFSPAERKDFISNVIDQKKLNNYEGVLKCKDGSPLYFLENISLGKDAITGEEFFDGILIDITERKQVENNLISTSRELQHALTEQVVSLKKIEESEKRYRRIIETAQEGIWLIDEYDHTNFVNKKMCEIIEYSAEELMGKKIYHFMNAESRQNSLEQIERRKQGISEIHDSAFITKSGKHVWVNISTNPVFDEDGKYKGALAMITDITERKQAELQLKASNERFINVTKATFDAVWEWDILAESIYWGEGFQTIFGYNRQELKTDLNSCTEYVHPEDVDRVVKGIYELVEGTETGWVDEFRYRRADQTYAHVIDKGFVIRNAQGEVIKMVGAMQDITGKKELENLLDKANKMARIGSWEVDPAKETIYWSAITKEIHETEPGFLPNLETGINFFKEGYSRDLIAEKVQNGIERGIPWDVELQIITARGNEKWVRSIGEAEFINEKCKRVYGSFQDIDARKRAELAVIKAFEEKSTILESIGDAFFTVDRGWKVTYWNNQAEKMLGISKNEILGHQLWEVFADSIDSESYKKYHEAIETGQVVHFEDYFEPLGKWYSISAYPSDNGLSVYFRDITDHKLSEMRLAELNENLQKQAKELTISNEELEQFAYVVSHDLQEPLRMVTSFLTLLEKKYGDVIDDKGKKYIAFAVDGAKRMRQIILDLLEFSRVGRTGHSHEDLDLNELVKEIQILFRKQIEEKSAVIRADVLPIIKAYRAPLRQVFQNLVSNALKYTRDDTSCQIQITTQEFETYWQFAVSDNGIGIGKEYFDKIFIIFQRLHNRNDFSGTGMGLAVTKKIIETLGGKIWVESKEGKGSTFYFTLLK